MRRIEDLFFIHRARSGMFRQYRPGPVAYVGNGLSNNAVAGFVEPRQKDKVFGFVGIVLSAFCEATVQSPPFIACGRAGNGLLALEPQTPMTPAQLAYIASYINMAVCWRFNWYRQLTADRVRRTPVPDDVPADLAFDVGASMPAPSTGSSARRGRLHLKMVCLSTLYDFKPGDFHSLSDLPSGDIPVVSCGDQENGVSGYFGISEPVYSHKMTIAFNGMNTLTAKYHPYRFAAKDDVAVCFPKAPLRITTELFIQVMMNRERWRYSYYRKCFVDKLRRFSVPLPVKRGRPNEDVMQSVVESAAYWNVLRNEITA